MIIETTFDNGQKAWAVYGTEGIREVTIGQVRVEVTDSVGDDDQIFDNYKSQKKREETYMATETGIGSGNVYTLGKHIFKTKAEALKQLEDNKNSQ